MTARLETVESGAEDTPGDRRDGDWRDGDPQGGGRRHDRGRGRRRRRAWRTAAVTVVVLAAAGATVVATLGLGGQRGGATARSTLPPATAEVARTSLRQTTEVEGSLGYGDSRALAGRVAGVLTRVPAEGTIVRRGQALYTVDMKPVVLLYGGVPAYRRLAPGMTGTDVRGLEKNLRALGYTGFTVDDDYTDDTATAVRAWQDDLGLAETGTVDPSQVLFAPGPLRVGQQKAHVGDQVGPGAPIFDYTGTSRVVTVALPVEDQHLVRPGRTVTVELPDGSTASGRVASVGTVAHQQTGNDGESGSATVDVTVTLANQRSLGTLDQAPVTVQVVSAERRNVLAVPVAALLALREGGYGVQVVSGDSSRVVAVETGMFADGQVEITGSGITEGTVVGVPAS
jgi:membrane fusion protein, multidrug efflux system